MTVFAVGQPVTTDTPRVVVDGGLAPGSHVFTLVVVDDQGTQSGPAQVAIKVVPAQPPPPPPPPVGPPVIPPRPIA